MQLRCSVSASLWVEQSSLALVSHIYLTEMLSAGVHLPKTPKVEGSHTQTGLISTRNITFAFTDLRKTQDKLIFPFILYHGQLNLCGRMEHLGKPCCPHPKMMMSKTLQERTLNSTAAGYMGGNTLFITFYCFVGENWRILGRVRERKRKDDAKEAWEKAAQYSIFHKQGSCIYVALYRKV